MFWTRGNMAVQPYCPFLTFSNLLPSSCINAISRTGNGARLLYSQIIASDLHCIFSGQYWPSECRSRTRTGSSINCGVSDHRLNIWCLVRKSSNQWVLRRSQNTTRRTFWVSREIVFRDDPYFVNQALGYEIFFFLSNFFEISSFKAFGDALRPRFGNPFCFTLFRPVLASLVRPK